MTKLAQALVEETLSEKNRLTEFDTDQTILRKAKEDEIRMRLDEFARELSKVSKQRVKGQLSQLIKLSILKPNYFKEDRTFYTINIIEIEIKNLYC